MVVAADLLYPQKSLRLGLITILGINIKDEKFLKDISPKTTELDKFDLTGLYWYLKDQKTLDNSKGYSCAFIGEIKSKQDKGMNVVINNNQEFTLQIDNITGSIEYYLRVPNFDEDTGEWLESFRVADSSYFNNGDKVLVTWDCPSDNPEDMLEGNSKMVKQEYLIVEPLSLSKRI